MLYYEVYENNAGNLYFCILEDGECKRIFEGFENADPGCMFDVINSYEDYEIWEGDLVKRLNEEGLDWTAQDLYDMGLGELIAELGWIYRNKMGIAGRIAFKGGKLK